MAISFSMLLNLVSASGSEDADVLWGLINRYKSDLQVETHPSLDRAVKYALRYYQDFIKPQKKFKTASEKETNALLDLKERLISLKYNPEPGELQSIVFSVGKDNNFEPLKDWFTSIYEILLGTKTGPRLGGFISLYGKKEFIKLISAKLKI